jgi:S1-C subfamily serine protease
VNEVRVPFTLTLCRRRLTPDVLRGPIDHAWVNSDGEEPSTCLDLAVPGRGSGLTHIWGAWPLGGGITAPYFAVVVTGGCGASVGIAAGPAGRDGQWRGGYMLQSAFSDTQHWTDLIHTGSHLSGQGETTTMRQLLDDDGVVAGKVVGVHLDQDVGLLSFYVDDKLVVRAEARHHGDNFTADANAFGFQEWFPHVTTFAWSSAHVRLVEWIPPPLRHRK